MLNSWWTPQNWTLHSRSHLSRAVLIFFSWCSIVNVAQHVVSPYSPEVIPSNLPSTWTSQVLLCKADLQPVSSQTLLLHGITFVPIMSSTWDLCQSISSIYLDLSEWQPYFLIYWTFSQSYTIWKPKLLLRYFEAGSESGKIVEDISKV